MLRLSCELARLLFADSSNVGVSPGEKAPGGFTVTASCPPRLASRVSAARWTVSTPARWRLRPPPMCIRHELSPAVQTSAPVSRTRRILSESIAAEVSAFLTANVPPKPQHSFGLASSTRSMPRTAPQELQRRLADLEHPQGVAGRVVGHPVRVVRADVRHPEPLDQELRELEDPGRERLDLLGEPPVSRQLRRHGVELAHHPDAGARGGDDGLVAARRPPRSAARGV